MVPQQICRTLRPALTAEADQNSADRAIKNGMAALLPASANRADRNQKTDRHANQQERPDRPDQIDQTNQKNQTGQTGRRHVTQKALHSRIGRSAENHLKNGHLSTLQLARERRHIILSANAARKKLHLPSHGSAKNRYLKSQNHAKHQNSYFGKPA